MKKILLMTYDNCDDSEVLYPLFRMIEEGWQVDVASLEKKTVKAKYHFTVDANLLFEETEPQKYDALMLPGGMAPEKIRQNDAAIRAVKHFFEADKPVAAICHGPLILISAGVLKGRKCTCYPGIRDDVINASGLYENSQVVTDGNLVTSRRPEDLPYFMREFVRLVNKRK